MGLGGGNAVITYGLGHIYSNLRLAAFFYPSFFNRQIKHGKHI
jgi:hypothetical protein